MSERAGHDEYYEESQVTIADLQAELTAARRLLEDLTPGGSEFVDNPERCAAWVRDRLTSTGKLAAERNAAREALAEAERELAKCGRENCMGLEVAGVASWVRKERLEDAERERDALAAALRSVRWPSDEDARKAEAKRISRVLADHDAAQGAVKAAGRS